LIGSIACSTGVERWAAALDNLPASGVVSLSADGGLAYTPNLNFHGVDTFTYTVTDGTATSAPATVTVTVTAVNDTPTGTVTIAGTATEGLVLTADVSTLADEDGLGTMTYEWSRAAALIDGATNNTYTLTQDDVGAVITVTASYIDGEGTPETVTSAATATVAIDTDGDGIGNHVDTDDDGDGFSDILEVRFNGDPLDPSDRDNLEASIISDMDIAEGTIQELQAQVAALSLRPTLEQVRDGRPGSVLLSVDSETGSVVLDFTVEESEDLITWTPVAGPGVSQTLTLPEGKRFYRFAD
jgi:hypothetical protein